jgi:Holliday junction resolvase RusA-like endonuclease
MSEASEQAALQFQLSLMTITGPDAIVLELDGSPQGKGRPRFGKGGRVFTPKATVLAEGRIVEAWIAAGRPRLEGAVAVDVTLIVTRPQSHYRTNGELNAAGLRKPLPTGKKPDVDNALKLVMDALNGKAYRDDVDVVMAVVQRRWSPTGWECTRIKVAPA